MLKSELPGRQRKWWNMRNSDAGDIESSPEASRASAPNLDIWPSTKIARRICACSSGDMDCWSCTWWSSPTKRLVICNAPDGMCALGCISAIVQMQWAAWCSTPWYALRSKMTRKSFSISFAKSEVRDLDSLITASKTDMQHCNCIELYGSFSDLLMYGCNVVANSIGSAGGMQRRLSVTQRTWRASA